MEIFIGFTKDDDFTLLKDTLEAWDELEEADISVIQFNPSKMEIARRVSSDRMAKKQYYLLVDLGCVPYSPSILEDIANRLTRSTSDAALIGLCPENVGALPCNAIGSSTKRCPQGCEFCDRIRELEKAPTGVRVCEKGAIEKWLPKTTDTYDKEHADTARLAHRKVTIWTDIFYKHLRVH